MFFCCLFKLVRLRKYSRFEQFISFLLIISPMPCSKKRATKDAYNKREAKRCRELRQQQQRDASASQSSTAHTSIPSSLPLTFNSTASSPSTGALSCPSVVAQGPTAGKVSTPSDAVGDRPKEIHQ